MEDRARGDDVRAGQSARPRGWHARRTRYGSSAHRQANGARLVRKRACDSLLDPVGRVGRKLATLFRVKLFDRVDKAEGALLNEVLDVEALIGVLLGDRDDKAQVRSHHRVLRLLIEPQFAPKLLGADACEHKHGTGGRGGGAASSVGSGVEELAKRPSARERGRRARACARERMWRTRSRGRSYARRRGGGGSSGGGARCNRPRAASARTRGA